MASKNNKPDQNDPEKLTPMQEKFVEAMTNPDNKNATQAAIKAGAAKSSANVQASKWLTKTNIRNAIERRRKELAEISRITPDEIFGSALREVLSTIDDVLDEQGRFCIKKARKTGAIHYVRKLSFRETKFGTNVAFEMADAAAARRELSEYLGMKQLPRENERKLKATVDAIRNYLHDHPDADREKVINVFARARQLDLDAVIEQLETIQ